MASHSLEVACHLNVYDIYFIKIHDKNHLDKNVQPSYPFLGMHSAWNEPWRQFLANG